MNWSSVTRVRQRPGPPTGPGPVPPFGDVRRVGQLRDRLPPRTRLLYPLLEIDVSTRDDVVRDPEWQRLFVPYPETRAVTARCLPIEEAFAEKLRALATRSRGRDLYDCWFLLQQDVPIEADLFERKMTAVGEPVRVSIGVTAQEWDRDPSVLVEHPPDYDTVLETVVDAIADAGLTDEDPP